MNQDIHTILDYWFGELKNGTTVENRSQLWFGGGTETDEYITTHFETLSLRALARELDDWSSTANGSLALIILLDQFPLNMYRKSARAYDFESLGIEICLQGLESKQHLELSFVEKTFFYLPLEHSENASHQALCVDLYQRLFDTAPAHLKEHAQSTLDYAIKHREIVDQFGHFPHRNEVLGRPTTIEETEFLLDKSNRFGQ